MKRNLFLSLTLVAAVLTGCKKDDNDSAKAKVMVTHASPDAPAVDILIDNSKVNATALAYPSSTGYLDVSAGERNVKLNVAGTSTTALSTNYNLKANTNYSVFAVNRLASLGTIAVGDNLATPAAGKAHIRFFHFSPGSPAVTVGVLNGTTFTPLFSNRAYDTQATAEANAAFTPVDAGSYNIDVRVAGTTTSVLSVPGVALQAGKIYTVFARGIVGNATAPLSASVIVHN